MKGFRQQTESSRKERLRALEAELKNSQMANRISQMLLQQMMQNMQNMQQDLGKALGLINELQYKILAIQGVSNLDVKALSDAANELRLKDFNEASDREDVNNGFTVGDVVTEDSTVILTSTTDNEDQGIFRSRIKLSECGVKDLIDAFMGREVGAKAMVMLNGTYHTVELLGIRQPSKQEVATTEEPATTSAEGNA